MILSCLIPFSYSAYTDFKKHDLYDYITLPVLLAGLIYAFYTQNWTAIITAAVVFVILLLMALRDGIAGGDVKLATAIAIWFSDPTTVTLILGLGALFAAFWGAFKLYRKGILKERLGPLFYGHYIKHVYGIDLIPQHTITDAEQNGLTEDLNPLGAFWIVTAWVVFLISYFF